MKARGVWVGRVSELHQQPLGAVWRGAAVLRRGACAVHAALGAAVRPLVVAVGHWRGRRLALAAALRGLLLPLFLLAAFLLLALLLRRRLAALLLALPCLFGRLLLLLLLLLLVLLLVEQVRARPQQLLECGIMEVAVGREVQPLIQRQVSVGALLVDEAQPGNVVRHCCQAGCRADRGLGKQG